MDPIADELPSSLQPPALAGVDRARLRQSVYRRVFGDADPVKIGRYTVLERIGAGGMGVVFKAYDTQLDRKVAVKVIHFEGATEAGRRALVKEARALARLSHPNVVHVYEVGESRDGELFLAMEFVEGVTLRTWLGREGRRWPDVLDVCLQAGEGIAAAHAAGLVHRDFKPENVMVGTDGRVRVLDFGLARRGTIDAKSIELALHAGATTTTTTTVGHDVAGTPAYMAPEQMTGGTLGPAVDQFALCATIYEALYGVRPFQGATIAELHEHVSAARLTVPDARCGVPAAVHRVIVQGLAADPDRRHASVQVLVGELRRARRHKSMRGVLPMAAMSAALTGLGLLMLGSTGALTSPVALEGAEREGDTQDGEVILLRAEAQVGEDPTAAIATLATLPEGSPAWNARAFVVAEQAALWGIADRELQLPEGLELQRIAGDKIVSFRESEAALEVIDVDTRTDRLVIDEVGMAPRPEQFSAGPGDRPHLHASRDGRWLVLDASGSTRLFDLQTRGSSLLAGVDARELVFSPDGELAAVREAGAVGVFRLATRTRIRDVPLPPGENGSIAMAIDDRGLLLAVARSTGALVIHGIEDGSSRELDETGVERLAFAGPSDLVTARVAGGLGVWRLDDMRYRSLGAADEQYARIDVVGGGQWLLSESDADTVALWDLQGLRGERIGEGVVLGISSDGRRAAWADVTGRAHVMDFVSRTVRTLAARAPIAKIGFSSDARTVVTYSVDRTVRRWPLDADPPALRGHTEKVDAIAFSRDSEHLFTAGRDYTLRRWGVQSGRADVVVPVEGEISSLQLSPDGEILASCTAGGTVEVRRADDVTLLHRTEPGHTGMAFAGDALIVTDAVDAWRWNLATGERTKAIAGIGKCHGIMASTDGERMASACDGGFDTRLRVWDLESGALVRELSENWFSFKFMGERQLVGGPFGEAMRVLDVDTGEQAPLMPFPAGWRAFSATPGGETFALTHAPEGMKLWTRAAAASASVPGTEDERLGLVALSSDGARLAYSLDRRVISIRERTVPRDPEALRAWVLEHRVVELETH